MADEISYPQLREALVRFGANYSSESGLKKQILDGRFLPAYVQFSNMASTLDRNDVKDAIIQLPLESYPITLWGLFHDISKQLQRNSMPSVECLDELGALLQTIG